MDGSKREPASSWRPAEPSDLSELFDVALGQGVTARRFRHGPYRLDSPAGCSDHLVALRLSGTCTVERTVGSARTVSRTACGLVTIQPAGQPSSWRVDGLGEMLYVFLPAALLSSLAEERDLPGERAEPVARLGVEDSRLARRLRTVLDLIRASSRPTMVTETLVLQVATDLLERHAKLSAPSRQRPIQPFPEHLKARIADYLAHHLLDGISIGEVAAFAGVSRSHFIHRFSRTFDTTPHRYVTELRIERAKQHLASGLSPVEVAMLTGFSDQAHLTTVFRRRTGTTPAAFRRRVRSLA
jgi:AraC family transcriptional regulator